jgi:tRNA threonylcarbamoyladenosine biosynthesis protein TsaE
MKTKFNNKFSNKSQKDIAKYQELPHEKQNIFLENKITRYVVTSLNETKKLAEQIAKKLNIGQVVLLRGNLGAGKTYFTSCIVKYLSENKNINVISPTFNIVKEYDTINNNILYHYDLYRIKKVEELRELDMENSFENGITIIEWPEIAENILYNIVFDIKIEIKDKERIFTIKKY